MKAIAVVDLLALLQDANNSPGVYVLLAFVYAIAAAAILPTPIEIALIPALIQQRWSLLVGIAIALAAGKTIGAWLIFILGIKVEHNILAWSRRLRLADWFVKKAVVFVRKTGYAGLYILLSLPFMSDTIPLYVYSLFNGEGALPLNMFLISNFLGALNRVSLLTVLFFVGFKVIGSA